MRPRNEDHHLRRALNSFQVQRIGKGSSLRLQPITSTRHDERIQILLHNKLFGCAPKIFRDKIRGDG